MEWAIPFPPEWNEPFHSHQNGMSHSIPARVKYSIPAGMEWYIPFRPEWNAIPWLGLRNMHPVLHGVEVVFGVIELNFFYQ